MKKILLVDDEVDFVQSVKEFLEMRGYEVITAYDGQEALKKVLDRPDLILLDIKMPSMDGFETLRRLQSNSETSRIPVIMLTSRSETDAIFEAQHLSAVDYIIKPTDLATMYVMVQRYLDDDKIKPIRL